MICIQCNANKSTSEFYMNNVTIMKRCKECTKTNVKDRRRTDPSVQAYDRARYQQPERHKLSVENARQWRKDNPVAYRAQTAVNNAIRDGRLTKLACQSCGSNDNINAHHHDYYKPLDVTWLCALCHQRLHAQLRSGAGGFMDRTL